MRRSVLSLMVVLAVTAMGCQSRAGALAGIVSGGVVIATAVTVHELEPTRPNDTRDLDIAPSGYELAIASGSLVVLVSLISLVINANRQSTQTPNGT